MSALAARTRDAEVADAATAAAAVRTSTPLTSSPTAGAEVRTAVTAGGRHWLSPFYVARRREAREAREAEEAKEEAKTGVPSLSSGCIIPMSVLAARAREVEAAAAAAAHATDTVACHSVVAVPAPRATGGAVDLPMVPFGTPLPAPSPPTEAALVRYEGLFRGLTDTLSALQAEVAILREDGIRSRGEVESHLAYEAQAARAERLQWEEQAGRERNEEALLRRKRDEETETRNIRAAASHEADANDTRALINLLLAGQEADRQDRARTERLRLAEAALTAAEFRALREERRLAGPGQDERRPALAALPSQDTVEGGRIVSPAAALPPLPPPVKPPPVQGGLPSL